MIRNKVHSLIGLATRAGKTVSGEFSVERAVKRGTACIVIVSREASDHTRKKFENMCAYYKVPIYFYGTKEELGTATGKEYRASLAVTDRGLSDAICKELANAD